jgi:hypothetical protein
MVSGCQPYLNPRCDRTYTPADGLIKKHPNYHLTTRNCQHFANDLALLIIDPTIVEPEFGARYRFTRYHLRAMGTVQHQGSRPGWIMPAPGKILINVTQMHDDQDAWTGEVEGSGGQEQGMFLRKHGKSTPFDTTNNHLYQASQWNVYHKQ